MDKFIRNCIAPLWAYREKSDYLSVFKKLLKHETISLEERRNKQFELFTQLINSSWKHCSFYQKKYSAVGFEPGDLKSWNDIEKLPVLTKKEIQVCKAEMLSEIADKKYLIPRKTSGSTGVSLSFYVDDREFQFKRGVTVYRDSWTGWKLGEWKALVWGNPEYLDTLRGRVRNFMLERCFSLDTLKMDEEMMAEFANKIFKSRPTMLFGHAHSLYLFAKYWLANDLPLYQFNGILSTAMVLHDHERKKCEEVFNCKVFNRYGCEEVSLIASECEAHSGLHVNTDSLIVEIEDTNERNQDGAGPVIITDLVNTVMPFIRYKVGDMAVMSESVCSCGRTYPILTSIAGRIADYLRTPNGEWVSGISLTENFATLISGIDQIQIIQDQYDSLLFRIVCGKDFEDRGGREKIDRKVKQMFGESMRWSIQRVERVAPEPSGKYRFSIYAVDS